jgi:hypothetical protein
VTLEGIHRRSWQAPIAGLSSFALLPFCVLLVLFTPPALGATAKCNLCAVPLDAAALGRVRTFCVDTSNLEPGLASAVTALVAERNHRHSALKRMPWTFTDQCAVADAVIRMYSTTNELHVREEQVAGPGPGELGGEVTYPKVVELATKVVLLVYDRPSLRVLYRTDVESPRKNPAVLLRRPFQRLVKEAIATQPDQGR